MALFEITLLARKTFFVEADSQGAALDHEATKNETTFAGDIEWEFEEGTARETLKEEEEHIREFNEKEILE
jgi:hypothetical protein